MKLSIFSIFILLPLASIAQKYEIGLAGGLNIAGKPTGNELYKAQGIKPSLSTQLSFADNVADDWQIGANVRMLKLARKATKDFPQLYSATPGGKDKTFVYGEKTTSLCFVINKKFHRNGGDFYLGAEMGVGYETSADPKKPTGDVYYISPSGSTSIVYGPHVGYIRTLNDNFSLTAEFAALSYNTYTNADAAVIEPVSNLHYRISAYMLNIGVKYTINKKKGDDAGMEADAPVNGAKPASTTPGKTK